MVLEDFLEEAGPSQLWRKYSGTTDKCKGTGWGCLWSVCGAKRVLAEWEGYH